MCVAGWASAANLPMLDGWHAVAPAKFVDIEDNHFRVHLPAAGLVISGDFDGDGRIDTARILESDDRKSCALFLTYSPAGRIARRELARFDKACNAGIAQNLYVVLEKPSTKPIVTWCGRGAFCEKGDSKTLRFMKPGIGYGFFEASYSITFWDDKKHGWRTALISD
jgi:hypothetical protein